jgi:ADP-ribose pyrophosphatase YjhB (NUDIX family)
MDEAPMPKWLEWSREIQGLAQTGLAFASTEYEKERYERLYRIAAEMIASHTGLDAGELVDGFVAQPGYATAKIDVRGACIRDGRLLLVQERRDQKWCMPGGWADVGDIPSEMVAREVLEESGLEVIPRKVVGVFDANRGGRPLHLFHAYKIVFLCDITGGETGPSDETMDAAFYDMDDLPPLSEARTNQRHIQEVRAHLADPSRPAAFD